MRTLGEEGEHHRLGVEARLACPAGQRAPCYRLSASVGLTLGDVPGLLIAAYLVKSLPLTAVRWVVMFVVFFTAMMLLQAGRREARALRLGAITPAGAAVSP